MLEITPPREYRIYTEEIARLNVGDTCYSSGFVGCAMLLGIPSAIAHAKIDPGLATANPILVAHSAPRMPNGHFPNILVQVIRELNQGFDGKHRPQLVAHYFVKDYDESFKRPAHFERYLRATWREWALLQGLEKDGELFPDEANVAQDILRGEYGEIVALMANIDFIHILLPPEVGDPSFGIVVTRTAANTVNLRITNSQRPENGLANPNLGFPLKIGN